MHKKRNMSTPLLDRFLFSKTKMLLGGRLRVFISGGAPLDVKTQRFINICMCTDVSAGYGLTETTAGATLQDMFDNRAGNAGVVLDRYALMSTDVKGTGFFGTGQQTIFLRDGTGIFGTVYRHAQSLLHPCL